MEVVAEVARVVVGVVELGEPAGVAEVEVSAEAERQALAAVVKVGETVGVGEEAG